MQASSEPSLVDSSTTKSRVINEPSGLNTPSTTPLQSATTIRRSASNDSNTSRIEPLGKVSGSLAVPQVQAQLSPESQSSGLSRKPEEVCPASPRTTTSPHLQGWRASPVTDTPNSFEADWSLQSQNAHDIVAPEVQQYHPQDNMSAFEYMFPAGMGAFSHSPHYDTVLQSSFSGYNSIPVPEVPLNDAHHMSGDAVVARSYGRPLSLSPASTTRSPHMQQPSPPDSEIMRQRREYHQSRRMSKSRVRKHRSAVNYFQPHSPHGAEFGLGITLSPTHPMTPDPAHLPRSLPTFLEGYQDDRTPPPSHSPYMDHYQPEHHLEMPMTSMSTSHAIYQPSPLPSMTGPVDPHATDSQYGSSARGTPTGSPGVQDQVRVLGSRPKPQCWDHGCNGRQFSTFSNLLRHQREKSGTASKSYCPRCGAEFTRTTARNGHMAHEKCKSRRSS